MKTKKITFNIKDHSISEFFDVNQGDLRSNCSNSGISAYHLMRDEILVSKNKILNATEVLFELEDYSKGSGKPLTNTYKYSVSEYDSFKYKLTLIDFKISVV